MDEITDVSYTLWWLKHALEELDRDPHSVLHRWTSPNLSGCIAGWADYISRVYFTPSTCEEWLLRGKVHQVMWRALTNAFRAAEKYDGRSAEDRIDLGEAYCLSSMIAKINPVMVCAAKVRLNQIAERMGTTLNALADCSF